VTALLPETIRHGVTNISTAAASRSFGVVAFALLILVLLEREAISGTRRLGRANPALTALAIPLVIAVSVMLAFRIYVFTQ
jgi:hypothetical protein